MPKGLYWNCTRNREGWRGRWPSQQLPAPGRHHPALYWVPIPLMIHIDICAHWCQQSRGTLCHDSVTLPKVFKIL